MTRHASTFADVEMVVQGSVPSEVRSYAEDKIVSLARYTREPILHARIRLRMSNDPAMTRPAIAQANLDVNGRPVRVQAGGRTLYESVDILHDQLRRRLGRLARHWEARRGQMAVDEPHEWRHSSEPSHRPAYFPRPPEERQVVRHKAFELVRTTPDEANLDLELMDYSFQLFTDLETGQDAVLFRDGPTRLRLALLEPLPGQQWQTSEPMSVSERPAPVLSLDAAITRLNATGLPFVFYADETDHRGRLLYLRYDGHYGLITPVS